MTEARPITKLNTSALKSALTVLKTFLSQINLHQATMTAFLVMPGSVATYTIHPCNDTQASGQRKDEKSSLTDGASRPTSNTTFTPEQRNGGKRNPTTTGTNENNPSGHQRQKKPSCGVCWVRCTHCSNYEARRASGNYEARGASGDYKAWGASGDCEARGASGGKYKAQMVIFRILAAVNRFSWISQKDESR
jgi:hypothetical protein